MDGTTAGPLDLNPPTPQSAQPPTVIPGSLMQPSQPADLHGAVSMPPAVIPVPASTPQPQYSQLTPVYAPSPTNTIADIPQPVVKGLEFVQTPTAPLTPTTPVPVTPLPQSIVPSPSTPIVNSAVSQSPQLAAPTPQVPAPQVMQPILPPLPQPVAQTVPTLTLPQPVVQATAVTPPLPPPQPLDMKATLNPAAIVNIENQIESVDLDQMAGVVAQPIQAPPPAQTVQPAVKQITQVAQQPQPVIEPVAIVAPPVTSNRQALAQNYFQNPSGIVSDVPITKDRFNFNSKIIIKIAIVVAIIAALGIGGFFAIKAITGSQQAQTEPITDTSTTPTVSEPVFTQTDTETAAIDQTATDTTTEPESTTEAPAVTTPETTITPVASDTVPTVANTGISDDYASLPKTLKISKLGINAPVEKIGVTSTGAMGVSSSLWNAGWYVGSARPGQGGAVFMDGHSTSSRGALFGNLDTLINGDILEIVRNDGIKVKYSVAKVSVVNRHNVDMAAMLQPYNMYKNGLNILSCSGQWIAAENTLENRVMVYAVQL